ncbi:M20/M25/M40 family metallo-hydrolase [Geodermatophilus sp. TF02-6]|uniref:M20/M25/M40 family metallo-hydrolase n=1 Tax=Geodermatophilus sp. TF02-6 TaxID=2250575 RepID=UPI0018F38AAD|nr:M20/M25/M40 family metallo-hydrolase [Geodermatophilus sp. TF02-6]
MPAEQPPPRGRRLAGLVVVALLLGLTGWSVAALGPPSPLPPDAPADRFSAARAFEHVQRVGARPHVAGSAADADVVTYLVDTLTGLGLDTRVQTAVGARPSGPGAAEMATVRNVVAVLPGSDPAGRLFLVAHHDSVQTGPGASDDGAGVAALLESVRALAQGPRPRNDVVVLFTDAEEACLCGAEAFIASHPLAGQGGVVLNFEARGTGGPPVMFQTSPGNSGLAAVFAGAAPHPVATSFAVEVYRALPNDTDLTPFLDDGRFTGMNTAFVDGAAAYHTPQDTPDRQDPASLQAMGDNALALARALGDRDLATLAGPAAGDATYLPVLGRLVRYPGSLVWPLAAAAAAAVLLLVGVLARRGTSSPGRTAAATGLALLPLAAAPLAVHGLWLLLVAVRPGYRTVLDPWRPGWYRLAAVALVLAVVLAWYGLLRRRVGAAALAAGALVWLAVLGVVLAALAPGGSYLAALPALAGALAGLVRAPGLRPVAVLLAGAVAVVVLAPTVALFLPALGMSGAAAPSVVVTLGALALLPAVELLLADGRRLPAAVPGVAVVAAVACTLAGLSVDRFDPRHPIPSQLAYVLDTDAGRAWWATTEADPGEYTSRYVRGPSQLPAAYPYPGGDDVSSGPAQVAALPAPRVEPVAERLTGGRREITVRVIPQREGVRLLALDLDAGEGTVVAARAEARDVPEAALGGHRLRVTFSAPPADGVELRVTVEGGGPPDLLVVDGSDGLDGLPGFVPRPADVDAAGSHSSDLVLVSATVALG